MNETRTEDLPPPPPPKKSKRPRPAKQRKTPRWVRVLHWLVASALLGFIFAVIAFSMVVQHYSASLPSTDQLANYDPAVVTRLYAGDGKLLAEYAKEKRFFLPLSAIPKKVQQAFLSAEDKNFYSHQGVDIWGMLRAVKENVLHYGQNHALAGGSTITQQVVKNFLLTSEKSFERKIKEAILAYRISNIYSKEKILELYLNEIYLGEGTYGVAAASITYFNKSLDQLTTEEAALLAAMPKAPAYFSPSKNYSRALERRNYVIHRMREDGYITDPEAKRALATAITTRSRGTDEIARADYFAEEVRRNLAGMYGSDVLYKGGLFVKTTLNPKFQAYADRALRHALMMYDQRHGYRGPLATIGASANNGWPTALSRVMQEKGIELYDQQQLAVVQKAGAPLEIGLMSGEHGTIAATDMSWVRANFTVGDVILVGPNDAGDKGHYKLLQVPAVNGAMVVMDPQTGRVLAMSGGYGGGDFNRATQAKRQPGSSFKPFVYLTALENGFSPNSVIMDGPISLPQGPGLPMWSPKNYEGDYLGPVTFRTALEHSRNAVTVRIASLIGIKRIKRVAKRLGIYDDDIMENYSMVLGAKETTLMKLVTAYSMIDNGGRRVSPWLIERIDDRNGATIFRRDTRACESCVTDATALSQPLSDIPPTIPDERERVIDPRVAYQLTSILEGVVARGTGTAARVLNRPVAGKTGTTNESRDTWFIGFTPDVVVGTYVGFDTPKSLGEKETGGRVAIQGFIKFMQQAANEIPAHDFRPPPGIREIPIDRASGKPLFEGAPADSKSVIKESFLTGGPIFKPQNELDEELQEKAANPNAQPQAPRPEDLGVTPTGESGSGNFAPPAAGEMAPYQRPVERPIDPQGFNPESATGAGTGTGGVY